MYWDTQEMPVDCNLHPACPPMYYTANISCSVEDVSYVSFCMVGVGVFKIEYMSIYAGVHKHAVMHESER